MATHTRCKDCGVSTSLGQGGDYYVLHDELWRQATPDGARFLCLDCVEVRLDRKLVEADFVFTPPEMLARLHHRWDGPLFAFERQRDLEVWRVGGDGFRELVMQILAPKSDP